jgi:hypothetical protein
MNDIQPATGFLAEFKREIEPRMNELADLLADRNGKKRIKIPVRYDDTDDLEYQGHTASGRTYIAVF